MNSSATQTTNSLHGDFHETLENQDMELQEAVPEVNPEVPAGYPKLAERMSAIPEAAIFRRFGSMNAQNLLFLQAELVELEHRIIEAQGEDSKGSGDRKEYVLNWLCLQRSGSEQWKLAQEMRKLLKEYNMALIQQACIVKMAWPDEWDLNHIQHFLESPEMGPLSLWGRDCSIWGFTHDRKNHAPDLIALLPRKEQDPFTKWISNGVLRKLFALRWLQSSKYLRSSKVPGLLGCKDATLARCTFVVTSMLASALLILSVSVLYFVSTLKARLGLIAAFNLLLTFSLAAFTTANRSEVFAVAAAWAAVQVVFIQVGSDGGSA